MKSNRLEAFSDGVIAILITIMVLELRVPDSTDISVMLQTRWQVFLAYMLSFIHLGIYWNNHHHMLQATNKINGRILWANLNLLFWLSLFPFGTAWMGEHFAAGPTAFYGIILLLAAASYTILQTAIVKHEDGENELLARAVGKDRKGKISVLCYLAAVPLAFVNPWISAILYLIVAAMWLVPDRRIENKL